jgi:hypothetical protein
MGCPPAERAAMAVATTDSGQYLISVPAGRSPFDSIAKFVDQTSFQLSL